MNDFQESLKKFWETHNSSGWGIQTEHVQVPHVGVVVRATITQNGQPRATAHSDNLSPVGNHNLDEVHKKEEQAILRALELLDPNKTYSGPGIDFVG